MRVLYVAYRVPHPPDKGERIRAFHQIRHLGKHGRVHLVCPVRRQDAECSLEILATQCATVGWVPDSAVKSAAREAVALARGLPRSRGTYHSSALSRAVARVLASASVDVIIASTVYTAESVRWVTSVPKVVDFMDVYSEFWHARGETQRPPWSWADRVEADRLARYEATIAREFDGAVFVSEAESALFQRLVGPVEAAVVGNGVDLEYFSPTDEGARNARSHVIVFTGSMDYSPNINAVRYFCSEILPRVRSSCPDVRFLIVGRDPSAAVRSLARDPAVTVTGTVPDVRPYLATAAVAVAPFQSVGGVQNKILEAMAMGLPVVSSSTALQAFGREPCEGLRPADEPHGFAKELGLLLEDPDRRARLGRSARRYVERWHRWEDLGRRLDQVLSDVVDRRTRSA